MVGHIACQRLGEAAAAVAHGMSPIGPAMHLAQRAARRASALCICPLSLLPFTGRARARLGTWQTDGPVHQRVCQTCELLCRVVCAEWFVTGEVGWFGTVARSSGTPRFLAVAGHRGVSTAECPQSSSHDSDHCSLHRHDPRMFKLTADRTTHPRAASKSRETLRPRAFRWESFGRACACHR